MSREKKRVDERPAERIRKCKGEKKKGKQRNAREITKTGGPRCEKRKKVDDKIEENARLG